MQPTDRPAFAKLANALFAAFDKPPSDPRLDAYWLGLQKMHLHAFEQTVTHVVGPEGPEELPSPKQLFSIHRKVRNAQLAAERESRKPKPAEGEVAAPEPDRFECYASRVLLAVLCSLTAQHSSAATDESLARMVHVKHYFADQYRAMCIEDPDAALDMRDCLRKALEPLFVPREIKQTAAATQSAANSWERSMVALAASNADSGHNAPLDAPKWRRIW